MIAVFRILIKSIGTIARSGASTILTLFDRNKSRSSICWSSSPPQRPLPLIFIYLPRLHPSVARIKGAPLNDFHWNHATQHQGMHVRCSSSRPQVTWFINDVCFSIVILALVSYTFCFFHNSSFAFTYIICDGLWLERNVGVRSVDRHFWANACASASSIDITYHLSTNTNQSSINILDDRLSGRQTRKHRNYIGKTPQQRLRRINEQRRFEIVDRTEITRAHVCGSAIRHERNKETN